MFEAIREKEELWSRFTRKEEYNTPFLDKHCRFPYYMSGHREPMVPDVSEFLVDHGLSLDYGENKKFAVCLTHDVDSIGKSFPATMHDSAKSIWHRDVSTALTLPLSGLKKNWNPCRNFEKIMSLEESYGAVSTFFFKATDNDPYEQTYAIGDLRSEIKTIADKGWDLGLHGGYYAYDSLETMRKEKQTMERVLGKEVIGYRSHYLRFKVPDTWELLEKAGFKYDSTFGYADCTGFRNGMCHPFRPYDLTESRWVDLVEIPLTVMIDTLFNYMTLDTRGSWDVLKTLINVVEKNKGVITVLWHNDQMSGEYLKLYEKLLEYCREKNALMTGADSIYRLAQ